MQCPKLFLALLAIASSFVGVQCKAKIGEFHVGFSFLSVWQLILQEKLLHALHNKYFVSFSSSPAVSNLFSLWQL